MPKRRRSGKKRKKQHNDEGPPHKKQRTSFHPITIPYPPPKQSSSNHTNNKSNSKHTNTKTNNKINKNNKNILPFTKQKRIIQIGHTQKEFSVSDLMLFEFFRKRYSELWTKYNNALLSNEEEQNNNNNKNDSSSHIHADFENDDEDLNNNHNNSNNTNNICNDTRDEDICSILVDNFDVNDLTNLIFFLKNKKIPILMEYNLLESFLYISDFFTIEIKYIHFEKYFEHYPNLIPYNMFDKWLELNILTVNNKKQLKSAINKHLNKYRKISNEEKKKLIYKIQKCLIRIIKFENINNYNYIDLNLNDLCLNKNINKHIKIVITYNNKYNKNRLIKDNGKTIIIENNHKRHKHRHRNNHTHNHNNNNNNSNSNHNNNNDMMDVLTDEQIRKLNSNALMIYWDGFKALNIKLNEDYNNFIDKYILAEIFNIINYYFKIINKQSNNNQSNDINYILKCIPYSKLLCILTDIYTLLFGQKSTFDKWKIKMKPLLEYIHKLSFIFFQFEIYKLNYDCDEYENKNNCFTKLFKRFLIHSIKYKSYKFKDIMNKLVYKEPFIMYLYEQEQFMENVFFKNINLTSVQQTELAKKLQTCNVYKNALSQNSNSNNNNNNNNNNNAFVPKYKQFIQQTLGITNESDRSLLMNVPL